MPHPPRRTGLQIPIRGDLWKNPRPWGGPGRLRALSGVRIPNSWKTSGSRASSSTGEPDSRSRFEEIYGTTLGLGRGGLGTGSFLRIAQLPPAGGKTRRSPSRDAGGNTMVVTRIGNREPDHPGAGSPVRCAGTVRRVPPLLLCPQAVNPINPVIRVKVPCSERSWSLARSYLLSAAALGWFRAGLGRFRAALGRFRAAVGRCLALAGSAPRRGGSLSTSIGVGSAQRRDVAEQRQSRLRAAAGRCRAASGSAPRSGGTLPRSVRVGSAQRRDVAEQRQGRLRAAAGRCRAVLGRVRAAAVRCSV